MYEPSLNNISYRWARALQPSGRRGRQPHPATELRILRFAAVQHRLKLRELLRIGFTRIDGDERRGASGP